MTPEELARMLPGLSGNWEPPPGAAIVLHPDQTTKQPVIWRCINEACRETSLAKYFEFKSDEAKCPKCTLGPPTVQKRALIHLLIQDPKGPIVGDMGIRYRMACDRMRIDLATPTNGEAATGDAAAANCPGCLAVIDRKLMLKFGQSIGLGG